MAISLVGTATANGADSSVALTLNLPAGLQENDVVWCFPINSEAIAINTDSSGWTRTQIYNGTFPVLGRFYKVMGAVPDTTFVQTASGGSTAGHSIVCFALRGVDTGTPEDAALVTGGNSTNDPDPGSVTTVTANAWVIAVAASSDASGDATVTEPSGYSNPISALGNGSGRDSMVAGATKLVAAAGAEDPGAFTNWTTGDWVSVTVAVRPAAVAGGSGAINMLLLGVG
jgi:hypothetical protein